MKGKRKLINNALAVTASVLVAVTGNMSIEFAGVMSAIIVSFNWANTKEYL